MVKVSRASQLWKENRFNFLGGILTATESRCRAGQVPLNAGVQEDYHKLTKRCSLRVAWRVRGIGST